MSECPTCGEGFKNTHGVRIHHVQAHGESIAGEQITCEQCGENFTVQRDKVEERRFCSRECTDKWRSEAISGEDHHRYNRVSVNCDWCDDTIERPPSVVEQYEHDFCDRECRVAWVSENNSGKDHYDYSKEEVECHNCGETFMRMKYERERTERNFCSRECYNDALSDDVAGEDNFNWRGGYEPYYGPEWHSQRRKALQRDDYECQSCGLSREQNREQWDKDLEVHHIQPIRTFADTSEANQLSNLITLCTECHTKHEHDEPTVEPT